MTSAPKSRPEIHPGLRLDNEAVRGLLVRFIRDESRRAGFERAVVGVSGGVDSALSVTLAAEALGGDNVLGVLLPSSSSSPSSAADASSLLERIGVKSETIDISRAVDAFLPRAGSVDRVRRGNVMARCRMIALFDLSARDGAIVVGTSNKTEILLGYGTLYGDTACGINPIGDLYKTQVWELAAHLGVPKTILEKKPTADLWEGQTDEDELGFSYRVADSLLYHLVEEGLDDAGVEALGFEKNLIGKVRERMRRNEFKRRPPVIGRITRNPQGSRAEVPRDRRM